MRSPYYNKVYTTNKRNVRKRVHTESPTHGRLDHSKLCFYTNNNLRRKTFIDLKRRNNDVISIYDRFIIYYSNNSNF